MHVIWDMGGTLLDTYTSVDRMLAEQVRASGDEISVPEVTALTRVSIAHAIATLASRFGLDPEALDRAYSDLKASWEVKPAPLMPGARDVIDAVRSSGGLNLIVTHRDRASATTLIRQHDLPIDAMICAPDGHPRKPDPGMYFAILKVCNIRARDAISVGDREIDIVASQAAGVRAALLTGETENRDLVPSLTSAEPDWTISSLTELIDRGILSSGR